MLLSLILTPVLMVFGFIVGMTIFRVTSGLLLSGIFSAYAGVLGSAGMWIFILSLIPLLVLVAFMQIILVERSFSLVSELPSRVLNWIGGRTDLADQGALDRTRMGMIAGAGAMGMGASKLGGAVREKRKKDSNFLMWKGKNRAGNDGDSSSSS